MNYHLKAAWRSLARSKGFAVLVVVSLGFALSVNTTMYAVIDSVTHPWVPYRQPDRLFQVAAYGDPHEERVSHIEQFREVRAAKFYESMAAFTANISVVETGALSDNVRTLAVSPNFFQVLGVTPILGQTFTPDGSKADEDAAVVIGYDLWRRMFPGRTSIDGSTISIDGRTYNVMGVMPRGMDFQFGAAVWTLLPPATLETGRGLKYVWVLVRLGPGTSAAAAKSALKVVASRLAQRYGNNQWPFMFTLTSLAPDPLRVSGLYQILAGSAMVVLLISCANLANMMLARGVSRRRELALRLALGATRQALVWQLAGEAVILAAAGGVLGLVASSWSVDILINKMPPSLARIGILRPQLSWRVFLFAIGATALTALLFGLIPAWRASDVDVAEPLKESAGTTTGRVRGRYSLLVMTEIGLAMILLLAVGVYARDVWRWSRQTSGYDPNGLFMIRTDLQRSAYRSQGLATVDDQVLGTLEREAGVVAAAGTSGGAADGEMVTSDMPGRIPRTLNAPYGYSVSSAGFFTTMRMPLLAGRDFDTGDLATGAVIVNEATARWLWPGMNPIGRRIKLGDPRSSRPWVLVVGVSGTGALMSAPDTAPGQAVVYAVSATEAPRFRTYFVRVAGAGGKTSTLLGGAVRTALGLPYSPYAQPADFYAQLQANATRFIALVFGLFGAFALVLVSVGLYGVLAYAVTQRMREFAVRAALGAGTRDLFELVLREGVVMILGGVIAGAVLAAALVRVMVAWSFDFSVTGAEWWMLGAEAVLAATALAACVLPAVKAARANPVDILRAV